MKRFFVGLLAIGTIAAAVAVAGQSAQADQPQDQPQSVFQPQGPDHAHYLILAPTNHGYGYVVPAQAYAYGWFGVCAKPHAVFHWDYYDHRWIWW
jgi:hypothetical protein